MAWVSKLPIMWRVVYCKMVVFISSYHQGEKCHCQYTIIECFFAAECASNLQEVHVERVCFNWSVDFLDMFWIQVYVYSVLMELTSSAYWSVQFTLTVHYIGWVVLGVYYKWQVFGFIVLHLHAVTLLLSMTIF
jgi:hypothetical protein